jgi:hypothetical protein
MISVATAMLCKEQGITITGICAVYELIVAQKVNVLLLFNDELFNVLHFTYVFKKMRKGPCSGDILG